MWPDGIPDNPVVYSQEKVRSEGVNESSPSQMNRVFSQVSEPSYVLYQADKIMRNGVASWQDSSILWLKDMKILD